MQKSLTLLSRVFVFFLALSLVLSCQPVPVAQLSALPPHLQPVSPSQTQANDFHTLSWPLPASGGTNADFLAFSGNISYSGAERHPGSDTFGLSVNSPPQYGLILTAYKLSPEGKQYASKGRLALIAANNEYNATTEITRNRTVHLLAEIESNDGIHFDVKPGSTGFATYMYTARDGAWHGNLGNNCWFTENGNFTLEQLLGNVTLDEENKTFTADLRFSNQRGTTQHYLSPWQCSYLCEGSDPNQVYNEACYDPLTASGSFYVQGKIEYTQPKHLDIVAIPFIFSPANQDGRFDFSSLTPKGAAYQQLFRYTLPAFNGSPLVIETDWGIHWHGKQNATTFYPDGRYAVEVVSDRGQVISKDIQIDNTQPEIGQPRMVKRLGRKAVEVIVEDPLVNGVRAGLHRSLIGAAVSSNRPGKWNTAISQLDADRVLVSAFFTPNGGENPTGDYSESLIIRAYDKVMNLRSAQERPFDFSQPGEEEPPLPEPEEDCENTPVLLPDALEPLADDISQLYPVGVEPQVLNKYRTYTQQMQVTTDQLRAEGVELPGPGPLHPSNGGFSTQSTPGRIEPGFRIASGAPPSGPPNGTYSPKVQRLLNKYNSLQYEQDRYRREVLESLESIDRSLYQLLLTSTQTAGSQFVPATPEEQSSFEEYKASISELRDDFVVQLEAHNTYALLEASQTYTNLALVYDHLVRALLLGRLPLDNLPTDTTQTQYFSDRLEEITQPWQLVNFTANRLKAFQTQWLNKHYGLRNEMQPILAEAETTAYELAQLKKELLALATKARTLGIGVSLDELETPIPSPTPGDFSTQALPAVVVPVVAQGARQLVLPLAREAVTRAANWVLANPGQAAALVTGAAKIAQQAVGHRNDVQQRVRQLERLIGKENISPQQLQAYQAELSQQQTLLGEINGVIQNAKDKRDEANEIEKSSENSRAKSEKKCKQQNGECIEKQKCKPVHKIEWTSKGFDAQKHLEKHGHEFGLGKKDRAVYLKMALEFALTAIPGAKEVTVGNNITIKYDPASNQFFQGHKGRGEMGTFYKPSNPETAWEEGLAKAKQKAQSNEVTEHTCD